jgi:tetratricopeptide (TPR) repeat protein
VPTRKHRSLMASLLFSAMLYGGTDVEASARFHPEDAQYVVLEKSARARSGARRETSFGAAMGPRDAASAARAARELLDRARNEREPRFFGYAEALIAPWLQDATVAAPDLLLVKADIQQNRHDFANAVATLNQVIAAEPHDPRAYLQRATVLMVRGDFQAARADCRQLIVGGELAVGSVCMAQAVSATGNADRGEAMIRTLLSNDRQFDAGTRAWALASLADLARRKGADADAEPLLRQAMQLEPADDSIRCALADLLLDRGANQEVVAITAVDRPSMPLLLRTAIAQHRMKDSGFAESSRRFLELIAIDRMRAERAHLREEALYALDVRNDARAAAELAHANFKVQRESTDIRLLARAAFAAGDRTALAELSAWLAHVGYRDRKVESILRGIVI